MNGLVRTLNELREIICCPDFWSLDTLRKLDARLWLCHGDTKLDNIVLKCATNAPNPPKFENVDCVHRTRRSGRNIRLTPKAELNHSPLADGLHDIVSRAYGSRFKPRRYCAIPRFPIQKGLRI